MLSWLVLMPVTDGIMSLKQLGQKTDLDWCRRVAADPLGGPLVNKIDVLALQMGHVNC